MLFRDENHVLGPNTTVELLNGAGASTNLKLQLVETLQYFSAGVPSPTSQVIFIVPQTASAAAGALPLGSYAFMGAAATFTTASTSGVLDIFHDTGVSAPASGTSVLSATMSLAGTANTVVNGVPSATLSAANALLSPGDRLSLKFTGTLTNLVALSVTIYVARVA